MKAFISVTILLATRQACGADTSWANARATAALRALTVDRIASFTVAADRCCDSPTPVPTAMWPRLTSHLALLQPASSIGKREAWNTMQVITLRLTDGTSATVSLSTRASLPNQTIAILESDAGIFGSTISFYDADGIPAILQDFKP